MEAAARAHSNIALIKYWGKRADSAPELNLPATGSVSMSLSALHTTTRVRFDTSLAEDQFVLGGRTGDPEGLRRVRRFLDRIRGLAGMQTSAIVESENNFPSSSGLASSASAFAALALAASRAAGLALAPKDLSILARIGSGSAARSIFGGFVEMLPGTEMDGSDSHAVQLHPAGHWDLRLLAVLTTREAKAVSSRNAMERTARTSPYFPSWCELVPREIAEARIALASRDLASLGPLAERNCLRMHASALAADPPVLFWNPATVGLLHHVAARREAGWQAWCTIDAGPHVKVLCDADRAEELAADLATVPGVLQVIESRPGPGAYLLDPPPSDG